MINTDKSTNSTATNKTAAGLLPSDSNIEFFGDPETKDVLWFQNGNSHYFKDLDEKVYKLLEKQYLRDKPAKEIFQPMGLPIFDQVELYTYYLYGELDTTPDFSNGELSPSENWRDGEDCISLQFDQKNITIGNVILNWREIRIIDMIKKEYPDKHIAAELGICITTLDFHKRNLFKKAGVQTKPGLINVVNQEKI